MIRYLMSFALLCTALAAELPTMYKYPTADLDKLKGLESEGKITPQQLKDWDAKTAEAVKKGELSYVDGVRVYTYLYVAQQEAANLAHNAKGSYAGTLEPVSQGILELFFPSDADGTGDPLSKAIAEMVLAKLKARMVREDQLPQGFSPAEKDRALYNVGLSAGKWIPWHAQPANDYWAAPPMPEHDPRWRGEVMQMKKIQDPTNPDKRQAIEFWAGMQGAGSGDWRVIANQFLFSRNVPLPKMLQVRATLMKGLYDGTIVAFGSKYAYGVMRPKMRDPSVHYEIPSPAHPSYPSGHSTESTIAANILSHFFPSQADRWQAQAREAGMSRLWAGIHYPADHEAGKDSGKRVAEKVLEETPPQ